MDIIYLDYAKAFDSVVHAKLLAKLACYGINEQLLEISYQLQLSGLGQKQRASNNQGLWQPTLCVTLLRGRRKHLCAVLPL